MSTKQPHPLIPDKIIRFIFGIIVFSASISGGTYFLQSSLFLFNLWGHYAHWAAILIFLPALSGLVQHLIQPPARLVVAILGAVTSSIILYPQYEQFWRDPPSITDWIVFTLVVAGIGFTSSINPLDRHVKQRKAIRSRKKSLHKKEAHAHVGPNEDGLVERLLNSSLIRSLELGLTIFSIIAGIWGTISLTIMGTG